MSDHVTTLERHLKAHEVGDDLLGPDGPGLRVAIRALIEEIERLKTSMVEHFQQEHIDGDGPEIDRWKARIDAALDLLATRHTSNPQCSYCRELIAERAETRKALRGEK